MTDTGPLAALLHRYTCRTGHPHVTVRVDGYHVPVCKVAHDALIAAGVTLDPRPADDTALREAVIRLHDSLSPDATRNVLWANVRAALEANRG